MNLNKYRFTFIPMGIIFIGLFSLVLVVPGQVKVLKKDWVKSKKIQTEVEELKSKFMLISGLDQQGLVSQSALALKALPAEKEIPYILRGLRDAVSSAGFVIQEMKFAPGEISDEENSSAGSSKVIEELPIEVQIVGKSERIIELSKAVEERLPLFEIDSLDLNSREGEDAIRVELKLVTFFSLPFRLKEKQGLEIGLDDLILDEKETELMTKLDKFEQTKVETSHKNRGLKDRSGPIFSVD